MNRNLSHSMLWLGLICGGLLGVVAWRDWIIALGISKPTDLRFGIPTLESPGHNAQHNAYARISWSWFPSVNYVYETQDETHGSVIYWSTGRDENAVDAARKTAWKIVWIPLVG